MLIEKLLKERRGKVYISAAPDSIFKSIKQAFVMRIRYAALVAVETELKVNKSHCAPKEEDAGYGDKDETRCASPFNESSTDKVIVNSICAPNRGCFHLRTIISSNEEGAKR